jgi:predicted amidophosphoribosyltransferase
MKSTANYITTFERLEKEIELQNTKVCPNCGETVNKIAKACHFCGYRFKRKKKTT